MSPDMTAALRFAWSTPMHPLRSVEDRYFAPWQGRTWAGMMAGDTRPACPMPYRSRIKAGGR